MVVTLSLSSNCCFIWSGHTLYLGNFNADFGSTVVNDDVVWEETDPQIVNDVNGSPLPLLLLPPNADSDEDDDCRTNLFDDDGR